VILKLCDSEQFPVCVYNVYDLYVVYKQNMSRVYVSRPHGGCDVRRSRWWSI